MKKSLKIVLSTIFILTSPSILAHDKNQEPTAVEEYYMNLHGISAKKAKKRIKAMSESDTIVEILESRRDFAGSAVSHDPFKIIFMIKSTKCKRPNSHRPHYKHKSCNTKKKTIKLLRKLISDTSWKKNVSVKFVTYSLGDLQDIQEKINLIAKDYDSGSYSSAIDQNLNKVVLLVNDPEVFQLYLEENELVLPDGVIIEKKEGETKALSYGGEILATLGESACTSGFVVTHPDGRVGIVTAAHCPNNPHFRGLSQPTIPLQDKELWPQDIQWHSLPKTLADKAQNRILLDDAKQTYQTITSLAIPQPDRPVCMMGRLTDKVTCGTVVRTGFSTDYKDENGTPRRGFNMIQVTKNGLNNGGGLAIKGDSGGPVYNNSTAHGLIHAGDASNTWITPINSIYALGLRLKVN